MPRYAPDLACPRCGYDISGMVPTWTEACPLEGICSECGLKYGWVDIFRPERLFPAWSFEHVKTRRVRAWGRTVLIALRPRKLWGEMSMAAPIRGWRLAIMVLLLLLLMHLISGGAKWWMDYGMSLRLGWYWMPGRTGPYWLRVGEMFAWPYSRDYYELVDPAAWVLLLWGVLAPLPYLVLVDTMKQAKCRPAHLLRGWAYSTALLCAFLVVDETLLRFPWLLPQVPWPVSVMRAWRVLGGVCAGVAAVWLVAWWWMFTSRYLRLSQPRLVLALMLTVSLLAAVAICMARDRAVFNLVGSVFNSVLDPLMKGTGRR